MRLIAHRRNTREELRATPQPHGVEIDLRSQGNHLVLHHDPFVAGEPFEAWLDEFRHGTLILNVKEEGLEARILDTLAARGIHDFFFLDQSLPFLVRWAQRGERRLAVRVSEHEPIELALGLAAMVDWAWVDCFSRFPLDTNGARRLQAAGLRLCIVSPELHGRDPEAEIPALRATLKALDIQPDAVCSKRLDLWVAPP